MKIDPRHVPLADALSAKASPARSTFTGHDEDESVLETLRFSQRPVRILVVGGLTRLDAFYRDAPNDLEIDAVYVDGPSLEKRAEAADALVLVVANVSHSAATKVRSVARRRGTPLASATGPSVARVRAAVASAYLMLRETSAA